MRRAFTILAALVLVVASAQAFAADKRKMKWVTSIYAGPNGVGLKYPEGVFKLRITLNQADLYVLYW